MRFELFVRRSMLGRKKWYFRLRAANGQIVAQSEAYSRRIDALSTIQSIASGAGQAEVVEVD